MTRGCQWVVVRSLGLWDWLLRLLEISALMGNPYVPADFTETK